MNPTSTHPSPGSLLHDAFAGRPQHFSPFLVLGDPSPDLSVELAVAAVKAGATMLELGLPYSDPCADGPSVENASRRALAQGVGRARALEILRAIRARCPDTPLNLLVYGNLVHACGFDRFATESVDAGASSLLVPDIPLEEGSGLRAACRAVGLATVQMITPSTPHDRLRRIDDETDGFVYLVAVQGVTGSRLQSEPTDRRRAIADAARIASNPICVGFGLRTREDIQCVHDAGAHLAVVGSELIRTIEQGVRDQASDSALIDRFQRATTALVPSTNDISNDTPSKPPTC
ncbi:MAG: tryptophan synthase subunit alpha [Planctomycetota bacterium]